MPWEADQPGVAVTLIHLWQHHRAGARGAVCSPPKTDRSEPTESQEGRQCGANREGTQLCCLPSQRRYLRRKLTGHGSGLSDIIIPVGGSIQFTHLNCSWAAASLQLSLLLTKRDASSLWASRLAPLNSALQWLNFPFSICVKRMNNDHSSFPSVVSSVVSWTKWLFPDCTFFFLFK